MKISHGFKTFVRYGILREIKNPRFILMAFAPLVLFGFMLLIAAPQGIYLFGLSKQTKEIGVLDRSKILSLPDSFPKYRFIPVTSFESGEKLLRAKEIYRFLVIEKEYLSTGQIKEYSLSYPSALAQTDQIPLDELLRRNLLRGKVSPQVRDRVLSPYFVSSFTLDPEGKPQKFESVEALEKFVLPYAFSLLLILAMSATLAQILRGVSEEKENRMIEVLLSLTTPQEIFYGKILVYAATGMIQVLIWFALASPLLLLPAVAAFVHFGFGFMIMMGIVFAVEFLIALGELSGVAAGIGALGETWRESNQIFMFLIFFCMIPYLYIPILSDHPDGFAAHLLSFLPLTSPGAWIIRFSLQPHGISLLEFASSLAVQIAALVIIFRFSFRIFHSGLLLYGKNLSLKLIWNALRNQL